MGTYVRCHLHLHNRTVGENSDEERNRIYEKKTRRTVRCQLKAVHVE
jgi:hypothetical protein